MGWAPQRWLRRGSVGGREGRSSNISRLVDGPASARTGRICLGAYGGDLSGVKAVLSMELGSFIGPCSKDEIANAD